VYHNCGNFEGATRIAIRALTQAEVLELTERG
jgi:hypothetical protein